MCACVGIHGLPRWHPPANAGDAKDAGSMPGSGRSPEKEMGTCSSILAWEIPWTEETGGLQSMGCAVRHEWATEHAHTPGYINIFMRSMLLRVCSTNSFFFERGGFESPIHGVFPASSFFYFHEDFIYKMQFIYKVQLLISTFYFFTFFFNYSWFTMLY